MLSSCHSHTWGLILPMQGVSAVQEGYTPAGHQILARKSCRCPRLGLPFSCSPAGQKRPNPVHPISTHPSPNLSIKPAPCKMCHLIWCGDIRGPHRTHGNCSSFVPSAFQTCTWLRSWGRRCWSATKSWRTPCSRCTPPTRSKCRKSR